MAIVSAELTKKIPLRWRVIAVIVAFVKGGIMKKATTAFAYVCSRSTQLSEETMKKWILIILFQSICCWFSWATAVAQPLTSRSATASAYIERGTAWFVKGDYERALVDFDLAIASD